MPRQNEVDENIAIKRQKIADLIEHFGDYYLREFIIELSKSSYCMTTIIHDKMFPIN
jgi:hypothetical protein